MTTLWKAIINT
jgi:hypothetical protein